MDPRDLLKEKREDILRVAERHGAINVRIFGSVVRGEADEKRDIDKNVAVVTEKSPKERIRDRVLKEAEPI
jgi:hypothetical protein